MFIFWRIRIFLTKMGKTRSVKEEMDGKVFISRQSRYFSFVIFMIIVLFPFCTSNCRVNNCVSRQAKSMNRRNESTFVIIIIINWSPWNCWSKFISFALLKNLPSERGDCVLLRTSSVNKNKNKIQFSKLLSLSFFQDYGNLKEQAYVSSRYERYTRKS